MVIRPVNAPRLLIVDGMNLVFKQFHGFNREDGAALSSGGMETTVLFGCLRSLKATLTQFVPHSVIVVWEGRGGKKRRKSLYPEYKDGRATLTPEQLSSLFGQVDYVQELFYYLGMGSVNVPTFEADDVIYSLARQASAAGLTSVTLSSDKDLLQVIHEGDHRATWFDSTKGKLVNFQTFKDEVGLPPERFVDYKCLIKDDSDNLPGIMGIGKKTAVKILEGRSLAEYMAGPPSTKKREAVLFTPEGEEQVALMRSLVDLEHFRTPELDKTIVDRVLRGVYDQSEVRDLLEDFSFFSLLEDLKDFVNPYLAGGELAELLEELNNA